MRNVKLINCGRADYNVSFYLNHWNVKFVKMIFRKKYNLYITGDISYLHYKDRTFNTDKNKKYMFIRIIYELYKYIVACGSVPRQQQRRKQLYNSRYLVMVSQTSMFPRQQLYCNSGTVFSVRSVQKCKQNS
jgi:hypothetical protein